MVCSYVQSCHGSATCRTAGEICKNCSLVYSTRGPIANSDNRIGSSARLLVGHAMQRQSLTCSSQIGCIWPRVICCTSKRAISLNYRAIEPAEASPAAAAKTCVVLHGLLGSSQNWTNFARSLQRQLPTWRFILCDLRGHGGSHGFAEPHTIRSAAGDVADLTSQLAVPIDAIVGHSLGGKIALQVLADGAVNQNSLLQAVIVDTIPGCWDQERNDSDKDGITRVFNFIRV